MDNIVVNMANKSATDLTNYDGYLVKMDSGLALCNAATDVAIGVLTKGGATRSDVCIFGKTVAKLGGTVTANQMVTATTGGVALATTGTGARREVAMALEAGVSGDFVDVLFIPSMAYSAS